MRRISRLKGSIDLLRARAPTQTSRPYLCVSCKHRSAPFSTSTPRAAKVPFTENLRRKIWGTDNPPGQADPYGDASAFDQTKKRAKEIERREAKEARQKASQRAAGANEGGEKTVASSYEPATTGDELETVGGFEQWWKTNWDPYHKFRGFLPRSVMKNNEAISVAVHRALVEVVALKQAGIPIGEISRVKPKGVKDLTREVQIVLSETGTPALLFPETVSMDDIIQSLTPVKTQEKAPTESQEDVEADRSQEDPLHHEEVSRNPNPTESEEDIDADRSTQDPLKSSPEQNPTESQEDVEADRSTEDPLVNASPSTYHDLLTSWNPAWLQFSLDDPETKFAVLKRTMQLTGIRFPDSAIKSARDTQSLLSFLVKPAKPRKLDQALRKKEELVSLPNVRVYQQRVTSIDKEKRVGRWKIIEEELIERGLPVTGHRH